MNQFNEHDVKALVREADKVAEANGHKLRWFSSYLPSTESQQAVCEHCLAGVSCQKITGMVYTRGIEGKQTLKHKCEFK